MRLSIILIWALCQFVIEAAQVLPIESRGPPMQTTCAGSSQVTKVVIFESSIHLVVTWFPPDCEYKQIYYAVEYRTTQNTQSIETVEPFYVFDYTANPCFDDEITITAVMDETPGDPHKVIYNTPLVLDQVANMIASYSNNIVHVEWEAPIGRADCKLDYQITLEINNELTAYKTVNNQFGVDFNDVSLKSSDSAIVTIIANRGAVMGPARTIILEEGGGETGPVTGLVIEGFVGADTLVRYMHSGLTYEVNVGISTCLVRNVSVTVFNGQNDANNTIFSNEPQNLGPVNNLAITSSAIYMTARWSPPTGLEDSCYRYYEVTLYQKDGNTFQDIAIDPLYNYYDCTTVNTFSVRTMVGNVNGEIANATIAC